MKAYWRRGYKTITFSTQRYFYLYVYIHKTKLQNSESQEYFKRFDKQIVIKKCFTTNLQSSHPGSHSIYDASPIWTFTLVFVWRQWCSVVFLFLPFHNYTEKVNILNFLYAIQKPIKGNKKRNTQWKQSNIKREVKLRLQVSWYSSLKWVQVVGRWKYRFR